MAGSLLRYQLVALDCPDPLALADFYSRLLELDIKPLGDLLAGDSAWIELDNGDQPTLAFQKVDGYVTPTWPDGPVPQQCHLDFVVDDLDEGEAFVLAHGARKHAVQPGTTFRVYLDPVGHPFCLVKSDE